MRFIDTPHTPHGWDAGVLYEETTGTLMCGDLFTQLGDGPALTTGDVVGPGDRRRGRLPLRQPQPRHGRNPPPPRHPGPATLALMHGPSFAGDGAAALRALADDYDRRVSGALGELMRAA